MPEELTADQELHANIKKRIEEYNVALKKQAEKPTHRHYKGGLYQVLYDRVPDWTNVSREEDIGTRGFVTVYRCCRTDQVGIRSSTEFHAIIEVDGKWLQRFKKLPEGEN